MWKVTSGDCTLNDGCLFSPNYPQTYPASRRCEIVVTPQWSGYLHTHVYLDSDAYFDVDGTRFGTTQFSDLSGVVPKEAITWSTTYDGTEFSFHVFFLKVCRVETLPVWSLLSGDCLFDHLGCLSPNPLSRFLLAGFQDPCIISIDEDWEGTLDIGSLIDHEFIFRGNGFTYTQDHIDQLQGLVVHGESEVRYDDFAQFSICPGEPPNMSGPWGTEPWTCTAAGDPCDRLYEFRGVTLVPAHSNSPTLTMRMETAVRTMGTRIASILSVILCVVRADQERNKVTGFRACTGIRRKCHLYSAVCARRENSEVRATTVDQTSAKSALGVFRLWREQRHASHAALDGLMLMSAVCSALQEPSPPLSRVRPGIICKGMGVMEVLPGFFASPFRGDFVWQCHGEDWKRCPGGDPGTCAEHRINTSIACDECEPFTRMTNDGPCEQCTGPDIGLLVAVLVVVVALLWGVYWVSATENRRERKNVFTLAAIVGSQFVTLFQMVGALASLSVAWPEPFARIVRLGSLVNFRLEVLNLGCVVATRPLQRYTATALIVVLLILCMVLFHFLYLLFFRFEQCRRAQLRQFNPALQSAVGTVLLAVFISVCSGIVQPFVCKPHPNGLSTMQGYGQTVCWNSKYSQDHEAMVMVSAIMSCVSCGFLSLCLWVRFSLPHRLIKGDVKFLETFSFLFFRFRPTVIRLLCFFET